MDKAYLGQAIKFPLVLNGGAATYENGVALIRQSIIEILNTPVGTRFFLPEYGSRIKELVFEPNDEVIQDLLQVFIYEAISTWEKRAKFNKVTFDVGVDVINCTIEYIVLASNEIDSFIMPFYRKLKY